MRDCVILDTETTNFTPGQISQLSYIKVQQGKLPIGKNFFFTVETVNKGVVDITGRNAATLNYLSGGLTFAEHSEEIFDDLNGTLIVAHNVDFDYKFLTTEFARLGIDFNANTLCTMKGSRDAIKANFWIDNSKGSFSQENLVKILNIPQIFVTTTLKRFFNMTGCARHDSRYDVSELYLLYSELLRRKFIDEG